MVLDLRLIKIGCLGRYPSFFVYVLHHFSFARTKEKRSKKKIRRLHFFPTPVLFSAKQKELATLKQLFVFNAPKSTSASRQKNEAGPLSSFGED